MENFVAKRFWTMARWVYFPKPKIILWFKPRPFSFIWERAMELMEATLVTWKWRYRNELRSVAQMFHSSSSVTPKLNTKRETLFFCAITAVHKEWWQKRIQVMGWMEITVVLEVCFEETLMTMVGPRKVCMYLKPHSCICSSCKNVALKRLIIKI